MKDKRVTITFDASEKTFGKKVDAIKDLFKSHDLIRLEYGNIRIEGIEIKIEKLLSGGPM